MAEELYNDGTHVCVAFYDLVDEGLDHAIQCNQFLIVDDGHGALLDPGGNMTHSGLLMGMQRFMPSRQLDYILASHADPDIISSLNKWMVTSHCKVMISRLWTRFIPHFTTGKDYSARIVGIPDGGMAIGLGQAKIIAIPAQFLHAEGNFHFYDPRSKILFTGDVGASLVDHLEAAKPVRDFDEHLQMMLGFHRRIMVSNKVCRLWVNMVRQLDVRMIVPQHGCRFEGREMVGRFLDWFEKLECGIDLVAQDNYRLPA